MLSMYIEKSNSRINSKEKGEDGLLHWIMGYEMENVGARCRELARDVNPAKIVIEYDSYGWAWVSPKIEGMEAKKQ